MSYVHSRLLRINSSDRSVESVSKYDIIYRNNNYDAQLIKRVELKSAVIPNTEYNINASNNTWNFPNTLNGTASFTIPVGQYTITTLITEMQTLVPGLTVTQSALTDKLTFAIAGNFDMISDPAINQLAPILGISTTVLTTAGPETADDLPNLTGLTKVYISSKALGSDKSMITADKVNQNVFATVPVNVPYGTTQIHEEFSSNTLDRSTFQAHKNLNKIDVQLLDGNNRVIDLNGLDWEIILRVYI
jgi:hypothetical protein